MPRLYIALTSTKAQISGNNPATVYSGGSRQAAIAAVKTPVDGGTASQGSLLSNLFPHRHVVRRNLTGS
jgi:hypothetical protein